MTNHLVALQDYNITLTWWISKLDSTLADHQCSPVDQSVLLKVLELPSIARLGGYCVPLEVLLDCTALNSTAVSDGCFIIVILSHFEVIIFDLRGVILEFD